jgi:hypothetical protein
MHWMRSPPSFKGMQELAHGTPERQAQLGVAPHPLGSGLQEKNDRPGSFVVVTLQ